jgi:aldehyde:ferredoxin oxidoreductase
LHLLTGWEVSSEEPRQTAQRIVTARKLFNEQAGWRSGEDTLPPRMLSHALSDDSAARLSSEQLSVAINAYYLGRGWTENGLVSLDQRVSLGLADL